MQAAMHDPVIAADGHTYERHAMEHWLLKHGTSPITGAQLSHLSSSDAEQTLLKSEVNATEAYASLKRFKAMTSALVTAEFLLASHRLETLAQQA
ncbi:TPA: hypothetical protein ACH3X2_004388 [Trebouxia sp. C0005]